MSEKDHQHPPLLPHSSSAPRFVLPSSTGPSLRHSRRTPPSFTPPPLPPSPPVPGAHSGSEESVIHMSPLIQHTMLTASSPSVLSFSSSSSSLIPTRDTGATSSMDFQVTSKTYQGRQCGLSPFEFYRTFEMSTQGKDTNMHTLKAHRNSSPHSEVRNMDTHAGIASGVDFVRPLETTLGFTFADPFLLAEAMTHTSFSQEHPTCPHNERLEFLGDAVIGMIVAEYLIKRFPTWREGRMTNNRKKLVCDNSLDAHAKHLQIHKILRIGSKLAMQLKPTVWNAMHACAYESLFGAMFLDKNGGYDACMEFFLKDFQNDLEEIGFDSEEFNPKGDLIEFVQHFGQHIVKYDHFKQTLKNSTPLFSCYVVIGGTRFSVGDGPSKRRAEENAAEAALTQKKQIRQQLEKHPEFTEKLKARTALDKAKRRRLDDRQDGKEVVQQCHQHAQ